MVEETLSCSLGPELPATALCLLGHCQRAILQGLVTLPCGLNSGPESPLCHIDSGSPVTPVRWKQATVVCCAPHPQPSQRHRLQPTALGLSCWGVPQCHQQLCSQYVLNYALESVLCPIPVTTAGLWDPEYRTADLWPLRAPPAWNLKLL